MARTVKVGLTVDEKPFVAGVERAADAAEDLDAALDDVTTSARETTSGLGSASESIDDTGDAAREAARELERLRRDAQQLDQQIDDTTRGIRDLARAIAATSDEAARAELAKKLTGERGRLRELVDLRRLVDVDTSGGAGSAIGAQLAEQATVTFAAKFGPLLARAPMAGMNPAVAAIGAPLAIGVASLLGASIAGAVVGAAGVGGVAGGLVLAARDTRVQEAGTALGQSLSGMLGRASSAFVPETLAAIDTIRLDVLSLEPEFKRLFGSAARYVHPLTKSLTEAGRQALPGLIRALDRAEPVIDAIGDGIVMIGKAAGDEFADLADYADEGAQALRYLFVILTAGIKVVGSTVEGLSALFDLLDKGGILIGKDVTRFGELADATGKAGDRSAVLVNFLSQIGNNAEDAADDTEDLVDALTALNDIQLSVNDTERAFQAAIDDARTAFDKKVKSIDLGTDRGRRYSKSLDGIATSARDAAQAVYDQTGNVAEANAKIEEGREALYRQARAYGLNEAAARKYVDSVLSIPTRWTTKVDAQTAAAMEALVRFEKKIRTLDGRTITVYSRITSKGEYIPGQGTQIKNRWGGVYEHAQDGLLRDAAVYSPMSPARYAFAEPATGGEAFVPKHGNPARSLSILDTAARWYGATVQPAGAAAVAAASPPDVRVYIGDQELRGMVRVEVSESNRQLRRRVTSGTGTAR